MTEVARDTVTLSREVLGGELAATVNGQAVELARAVSLLKNADTATVTADTNSEKFVRTSRTSPSGQAR